ncbi:B-box zinc finger protein 24-like [Oryza glaberrima]|uniref:B box-type domain-containing protein n=1 Tax=Oryza glaberrima TaxID=4538 RepID=I1PMK8_ORYGL|nr:B-box zinc finger protein 24-like [Oryza glaberrima]
MRIQCDACEAAAATVVCCADEAALCARCDVEIHAANKLASKHQRLPLDAALPAALPRCDVCQEKAAFIFCVEDRALFCRDCDEPIHVPGTLSGNHQRYLATGIRVGFSSLCSANADHLPPPAPKGNSKPPASGIAAAAAPKPAVSAAAQEVPSSPFLPPSGWAVEDLLQLSDYESSDKKGSPIGFKDLEWLDDIDLFHVQSPAKGGSTAAEVPELFASPQPASNMGLYKASGARQSKKPRVEIPDDDEDFFIVPDLG